MTVNITHAAVVAIGARGTRDPRCSRRAASRSTGECRDDVRIARRYSYEKAGFAARFGAIEVDALHKDAMEMEVGVRRRLYLIV
jgi:hypothetical protein